MRDAIKPVTNPDLVAAIQRAREDSTAEAWAEMVREAAKAHFITPVDVPSEAGKAEPAFSLHMLKDSLSQQQFYMAFTDWDELRKWRSGPGQRVLILTFDDYARLVLDGKLASGGFIVNPFGGNVAFDRAMIEAVRHEKEDLSGHGFGKVVMEKGTTVCLGTPEEYPQALTDAISAYLKAQPGVKAAYLQLMETRGESSYLVAVDFSGDEDALFQGISAAARDLLNDLPLNLVSCGDAFWRDTAAGLEPFYQSEKS